MYALVINASAAKVSHLNGINIFDTKNIVTQLLLNWVFVSKLVENTDCWSSNQPLTFHVNKWARCCCCICFLPGASHLAF